MGIERERFVGNPNKLDLIGNNDDDDEYFSGDEIEFQVVMPDALPDLLLHDNLDILSDDDDEDYDPADDYEDFLSDSDFLPESEASGMEDGGELNSLPDTPHSLSPSGIPSTPVNIPLENKMTGGEVSSIPDTPQSPSPENRGLEIKTTGKSISNSVNNSSTNEDNSNT